jgi:hypothetical protein
VDVWSAGWQVSAGQEEHVYNPVYSKEHVFRVFSLEDDDQKIEFAAGELIRAFGGYIKDQTS